ncbi:NUDIX pyrophosphatase [bacterium]|nr:NUDIX pyrophosphatase [bacterium]
MNVTSNLIEVHIFRLAGEELEFLLLKRAAHDIFPGLWQMVTGSIDNEEKAYEAAIREIKEETGLTPVKFWVVPNVNSFYSPKQNQIYMVPVFAALVDCNIDVVISEEHSEYRWLSKEKALQLLAWPGQRNSVETIYEYFTNQKNFLHFVEISL